MFPIVCRFPFVVFQKIFNNIFSWLAVFLFQRLAVILDSRWSTSTTSVDYYHMIGYMSPAHTKLLLESADNLFSITIFLHRFYGSSTGPQAALCTGQARQFTTASHRETNVDPNSHSHWRLLTTLEFPIKLTCIIDSEAIVPGEKQQQPRGEGTQSSKLLHQKCSFSKILQPHWKVKLKTWRSRALYCGGWWKVLYPGLCFSPV